MQALTVSVPGGPTGTVFTGIAGNFLIGTTATTTLAPSNFVFATEAGQILAWRGGSTAALATPADGWPDAIYKGLALATPRGRAAALRDRLPQRPRRRLRRRVGERHACRRVRRPAAAEAVRAVRDPDDRRAHLRHLREAGRRRRGRDRQPGHGFVDEYDLQGNLVAPGRAARPAQRAVGPRDGARHVRPLRRRPARRQLRRRPDQRVTSRKATGAGTAHPAPDRRAEARDRRVVGARVRQRGLERRPNTLFFAAGPDGESNGLFGKITTP